MQLTTKACFLLPLLLQKLSPRQLLHLYWQPVYANLLPCANVIWTVEHVVPKSIIANRTVTEDLHNLILLPKTVNQARSNYAYAQVENGGTVRKVKSVSCCAACCCGVAVASGQVTFGSNGKRQFDPPDLFKGIVARTILKMIERHPSYRQTIIRRCLPYKTARQWNQTFSETANEKEWREIVDKYCSVR